MKTIIAITVALLFLSIIQGVIIAIKGNPTNSFLNTTFKLTIGLMMIGLVICLFLKLF